MNRKAPLRTTPEEIRHDAIADPAAFRAAVAARGEPAILRGLVSQWPVCAAARESNAALRDYLVRFATDQPAHLFQSEPSVGGRYSYGDGPDGFNFTRTAMPFGPALDRIAACASDATLGSAYLGSLIASIYLPGFAKDNPLALIDPSVTPRLWIGTASVAQCHYDAVDNLACVIAGHRRFTLYPPDAIGDLYVGPIDHTMAGQPVSLASADPDPDRHYPRFVRARERALVAELGPGDALYLPKLWWHQVEAGDPFNAMINFWWDAFAAGPDAPMLSMLMTMIAIAERPAFEREAFRAFFYHYVFRPEGHPLAHLPEERRGILRQIDSAAYGRIRATIMRELRGS